MQNEIVQVYFFNFGVFAKKIIRLNLTDKKWILFQNGFFFLQMALCPVEHIWPYWGN